MAIRLNGESIFCGKASTRCVGRRTELRGRPKKL